jgi:predicted homoserine dehydrogenase-like protein
MSANKRFAVLAALFVLSLGCNSPTTHTVKETEMVVEMVAVKDIAAGMTIDNSQELFKAGKLHEKGKEPEGIFLDNWSGLLKGKKVSRDLKKGEVVKLSDIVEADGSPFRPPQ